MRINNRSETRSISIAVAPVGVHTYLADALNVPAWAPAFAQRIRPQGTHWVVTSGDGEFPVAVLTEPRSRTVDIVAGNDHTRGLFTRVLPNADGSELLFTLFFPADASERAIQAQIATLDAELASVRDACEQR